MTAVHAAKTKNIAADFMVKFSFWSPIGFDENTFLLPLWFERTFFNQTTQMET